MLKPSKVITNLITETKLHQFNKLEMANRISWRAWIEDFASFSIKLPRQVGTSSAIIAIAKHSDYKCLIINRNPRPTPLSYPLSVQPSVFHGNQNPVDIMFLDVGFENYNRAMDLIMKLSPNVINLRTTFVFIG